MTPLAVVIGAGVDGLVAAHVLASAGHRVLVLERTAEREALPDTGWVSPRIVRTLDLERHGLRVERPDPWIEAPLPDGGTLALWQDLARSAEAIRHVSLADAGKWPAFTARMRALGGLLETIYLTTPPSVLSREPADLMQLAGLGLRVRGLGSKGVVDLLRILPMSVAELLDDWFEHDVLKALVGAAGILGLAQGPRSSGTAFLMLHHHAGNGEGVFRPPRSNLGQVLEALPGIEVRRGAVVASVVVRDGRVTGVALEGGEEIAVQTVVSGADPKHTLLGLVDPSWLDPEVVDAVRHIRSRGVSARVTFTLERDPGVAALAVAPSLAFLERAADDAKYGRVSEHPYLEARARPAAANGKHLVDVHVQSAPYALAAGAWDAARRAALGDLVAEVLGAHVPGFREAIVERAVCSPVDFEERYGWPEGQAAHAELSLDQFLFMRPVPALARYRTPIRGLYLCGPGMHPGRGAAGAAGANAARVVLKDSRRGVT